MLGRSAVSGFVHCLLEMFKELAPVDSTPKKTKPTENKHPKLLRKKIWQTNESFPLLPSSTHKTLAFASPIGDSAKPGSEFKSCLDDSLWYPCSLSFPIYNNLNVLYIELCVCVCVCSLSWRHEKKGNFLKENLFWTELFCIAMELEITMVSKPGHSITISAKKSCMQISSWYSLHVYRNMCRSYIMHILFLNWNVEWVCIQWKFEPTC